MKIVKIYLTVICVMFILLTIILMVMNIKIVNVDEIFNPTKLYRLLMIFNSFLMGNVISGLFVWFMSNKHNKP